jgi:hypothetical protein
MQMEGAETGASSLSAGGKERKGKTARVRQRGYSTLVANTPRPASLIVDTPTSSPLRHVPIAASRAAVDGRAPGAVVSVLDCASVTGDMVASSMPEEDEEDEEEDDDEASGVDADGAARSLKSMLIDDHATDAGSGTKTPLLECSRADGGSAAASGEVADAAEDEEEDEDEADSEAEADADAEADAKAEAGAPLVVAGTRAPHARHRRG